MYTGGSEGKDPKIANEDFSGIRGYLKLKRRNRGVNNVLMEEENASKNAKESLKKLHNQGKLTKEELNDAEKNLDIDYRSYEDDAIVYKNIAKLKRLNDKNRKRK